MQSAAKQIPRDIPRQHFTVKFAAEGRHWCGVACWFVEIFYWTTDWLGLRNSALGTYSHFYSALKISRSA